MLVELPLAPELDGLLLDGLEVEPLEELDGLELDGLDELPLELEPMLEPELEPEVDPVEPVCPACHSERESCPSWFLSSLSNSLLLELEDEVPPAAELGLEVDEELGLVEDVPPEDDLLLCDVDGEDEDPELLFESPAA